MSILAKVGTNELHAAARAWRHSDVIAAQHRNASSWFKWFLPEPNYSLHDRIGELVSEIGVLRSALSEAAEFVSAAEDADENENKARLSLMAEINSLLGEK